MLYACVGMSLVVTLLSWAYHKLSERPPLPRLAIAKVGLILVTILAIRLGLGINGAMWQTFCPPTFYGVPFSFTDLGLWEAG